MDFQHSSVMRVLTRPQSSTVASTVSLAGSSSSTASQSQNLSSIHSPSSPSSLLSQCSSTSSPLSLLSSSSSSSCSSSDGVVVVGFIGRKHDDVTQLINRILDANVFGSGSLDKCLPFKLQKSDQESSGQDKMNIYWPRTMSYFYEEEKRMVFLQFSSSEPSLLNGISLSSCTGAKSLDTLLEDDEYADLRGMLVIFSVCHIVLYLHEGSHFDTQIVKKLRILQAAKHALAPFVREKVSQIFMSKSSPSSRKPTNPASSSGILPSRGGGILSRHGSVISVPSGSFPSLFPGYCCPVILFVFLDNFSDNLGPMSHTENQFDMPQINHASNQSIAPKPIKSDSSLVMLTRNVNKTESCSRKKLQSSLEGQIRFLIKKCRVLLGSESHSGSKGGVQSPLFSLDSSKTVAFLDRSKNRRGESLESVLDHIEEVLNSNGSSDTLLVESHNQSSKKDDIQLIKEFIHRHSENLRGRGGMVTSTSSGSSGVGMVAVAAAAAAAASVSSGKPFSTPLELPTVEDWISCCHLLLNLLSIQVHTDDGKMHHDMPSVGKGASDAVLSLLENSRFLNLQFSTSWCEKALPVAKDIYLKYLPACYPTVLHKTQLEKAILVFRSMVKGPAVQTFIKRLEEECTAIWESGRQLCDAVSLTGKPCLHERHHVKTNELLFDAEAKPHSSGLVFFHACGCGRLRQYRDDPFDFESANAKFNFFPNCEKFLPSLQLPKACNGSLQGSAWHLFRVGGAKYYEPTKGLLLSGFSSTEKFLCKWMLLLEKRRISNSLAIDISGKLLPESDSGINSGGGRQKCQEEGGNQQKATEIIYKNDFKINTDRGHQISGMKKPFSEVVAESITSDSAFPPLQQKRPTQRSEKTIEKKIFSEEFGDTVTSKCQKSQIAPHGSLKANTQGDQTENATILQTRNIEIVAHVDSGEKQKLDAPEKCTIVYFGFEHECPYGHRFLLSASHLNKLGALYAMSEESVSVVFSSNCTDMTKQGNNGLNNKINRALKHSYGGCNEHIEHVKDGEAISQHDYHDNDGSAFSLLNRNLPIYMKCPHCKCWNFKEDGQDIKFASAISQLQRIFMVTPPFPVVLATCPIVKFEDSCLPASIQDRDHHPQFSPGCAMILPPESFVTIRLPFVYGVQLADGTMQSLQPLEDRPELTAWIVKGTWVQVNHNGNYSDK